MKNRLIALGLLAILLLGALVGCQKKGGPITSDEAQEIVIDHLGVKNSEVSDIHVHITENDDGVACFSIHVTAKGETFTYLIHGMTGEILSVEEGSSH